jgi:hypothetical protein
VDPKLFVWVDECGTHTSMTRVRARAPRGERAYGSVPRNRGKNTTLIASMTLQGAMGEAMAVEGSTKAFVFEAYLEGFLAPALEEGQIVVMDNLELAPIGWQLFILGNYESDSTAFPLLLDTYATRLLAEPLRRSQDRESARADRGEGVRSVVLAALLARPQMG